MQVSQGPITNLKTLMCMQTAKKQGQVKYNTTTQKKCCLLISDLSIIHEIVRASHRSE